MSIPNDPDATIPVPGAGQPFPGSDPTQPVTRAEYGGPGEPPPGGGGWDGEDEGDGDRNLWMIAGAVLVIGLLVGGLVALLASGGGDDSADDTTTTSSSTTSSTTTTTLAVTTQPPPTNPAAPQVLQFTVSQNPVACPNDSATVPVVLTWSTQNAQSATIAIDNPNGPYGTYGPSDQQQVPFDCGSNQHTYYLTANGSGGQKANRSIDVNASIPPTTTTTDGP